MVETHDLHGKIPEMTCIYESEFEFPEMRRSFISAPCIQVIRLRCTHRLRFLPTWHEDYGKFLMMIGPTLFATHSGKLRHICAARAYFGFD